MNEISERYGDLEELIEVAIREIEVAPSLCDRAREQLRHLAKSEGVDSIVRKIEEARNRKNRAQAWLSGASAPNLSVDWKLREAKKLDPLLVQQKAWVTLARLAQRYSNKEWAKLVSRAVATLSSLDEFSVRRDLNGAEKACIDLIEASEAPDFNSESAFIRGVVFAETANLYTICAKITRESTFVERGLFLYSVAAETISKGDYPLALTVVQINRGAALNCYAHLMQKQHFDKYRRDVIDVIQHLDEGVLNSNHSNEYHNLAQGVRQGLGQIAAFGDDFSEWNNWSELGSCSVDIIVESDVEKVAF